LKDKAKLDLEFLKKTIDQLEEEKASLSRETSDFTSEMKAIFELSEIQQFIIAHFEESLAMWKVSRGKGLSYHGERDNSSQSTS